LLNHLALEFCYVHLGAIAEHIDAIGASRWRRYRC
jgi:hypothetical protein